MSLLETRGLARAFGGIVAVDGVDFRLDAGEVRALIGPNGAGKTTFVGLVTGRIAPDRGRVLFDGRDVTRLPAHARMALGIGYSFQITSIFGGLSVFDNVALAVQRVAAPGALGSRTLAALAGVGLADRALQMAGDLSYGHQRLLEIAMGLAQTPRLLILDEPTQGLAEAEIAGFKTLVRGLAGRVTILLIEHNMDVVMSLAGRITVLDAGRILAEGPPEAIREDARVRRAYLGA